MTWMGAIQPISGSRRNFGKPPNAAVLVRGGERLCRVERGHEPEPLVLSRDSRSGQRIVPRLAAEVLDGWPYSIAGPLVSLPESA